MVEVMKIKVTSFKRSHACAATLSVPNPVAGHLWPTPLLETPGHSQASLGQSLFGSPLLSPGSWCTRFCLCPPRVYFPALCKFWQLYGGVNGDLLQEEEPWGFLAIPKSAAPRVPVPVAVHCWPIPPQQTFKHSSVSVCGILGSWCAQGLFEPSEHLWREWGLILNVNSPLQQSCWGFSFALGHGVSLHSCSSAYLLNGVSLTLAVGDLLSAAGSRALMEVISIPCKLIYVGEGWGSRPDMCKAQQNSVFWFAYSEFQPGFGRQCPGKTSYRRGIPVFSGMNPVIIGVWHLLRGQRRLLSCAPLWNCSWVAILVDLEGVSLGGGGPGCDAVGELKKTALHGALAARPPQGSQCPWSGTPGAPTGWGPAPVPWEPCGHTRPWGAQDTLGQPRTAEGRSRHAGNSGGRRIWRGAGK